MTSVRISSGRLTALWVILRSLEKLGSSARRNELVRHASRTSLRAGGLPIQDGLTLALEGGFISIAADLLKLAPLGLQALALDPGDEPPSAARRLFISVLLLRDPPPWVAYWQGDPSSLDLVIPESERDLLREADLYPTGSDDDLENWSWWDALQVVPLAEETSDFRKLIGDAGEELSLRYERERLQAEGYPELAARVRWVARESAAYGFDVFSFHGASRPPEPHRPLAVEVKSVARPIRVTVEFFLTSHEWSTAQRLGDNHTIHFWDGVDPGPPPRARGKVPLLIACRDLANHIPLPPSCASDCAWFSARLAIPRSEGLSP